MDECKRVMDHTDDLVVDRLLSDLRVNGRKVDAPSDPFHDVDFIHALMETYTIAPTIDWLDEVA
jgi:hypothetical protein